MNKWTFTGNLGRDPSLRELDNATVLHLAVAVSRRVKRDGEWTNDTMWVDVSLFGRNARWLGENLRKGSHVAVSGELGVRSYTGRDGALKTQLEVTADAVELLDKRQDAERQAAPRGELGPQVQRRAQPVGLSAPQYRDDDDIPF